MHATGGDRFKAIISQGIEGCEAFIALISDTYAHAKQSPWTLKEFNYAEDIDKAIIPVSGYSAGICVDLCKCG